jgi:hypothetical protein
MAILDAEKRRKCSQELMCGSVDLIQLANNSSWQKYCARGYYEGESNENLKSAIKIRNPTR